MYRIKPKGYSYQIGDAEIEQVFPDNYFRDTLNYHGGSSSSYYSYLGFHRRGIGFNTSSNYVYYQNNYQKLQVDSRNRIYFGGMANLFCYSRGSNFGSPEVTVTITHDNFSVNRISAASPDISSSYLFSTHPGQKTLLETTTATFIAALEASELRRGPYEITSATFTVGDPGDDYVTNGDAGAHVVKVTWDSSDPTWNDADADLNVTWDAPGLTAGVDYETIEADTGIPHADSEKRNTLWSGLASTVQAWLDGTVDNNGLVFPDSDDASTLASYTLDLDTVFWTIKARERPIPSVNSPWILYNQSNTEFSTLQVVVNTAMYTSNINFGYGSETASIDSFVLGAKTSNSAFTGGDPGNPSTGASNFSEGVYITMHDGEAYNGIALRENGRRLIAIYPNANGSFVESEGGQLAMTIMDEDPAANTKFEVDFTGGVNKFRGIGPGKVVLRPEKV